MQTHAYSDGHLPSDWCIPGLDLVAHAMPYRATHASLRSSAPAPSPAFDNSLQQLQVNVMQQLMAQCLRSGSGSAEQQPALTDGNAAADGVNITLTGGTKTTPPKTLRTQTQRGLTLGSPQPPSTGMTAPSTSSASLGSVGAQQASPAPASQVEPAPASQVERDAVAAMEASFASAMTRAKKAAKERPEGKAKGKAKGKAPTKAKRKAALALADVPHAPATDEEEEEEEDEHASVAKATSKVKTAKP
ncbi:hypothetical protein N9L68_08505, partial [bacterium]|nr:hypothetical protein [bacterium]